MSTHSPVGRSILATLVYHDILNHPLTAWEVFQFLLQTDTDHRLQITDRRYGEIQHALEELKKYAIIDEKNGFYCIKGRDDLFETRIERTKVAEEKWHEVAWVLKLFRAVPFVRSVYLSGSVAMGNATEHSDVDILVVAEKGRIWMVRFFLSLLTLLCGKLRAGRISKKTAGKICLNHYITTGSLALEAKGLYNAATYLRLAPVFGEKWLERFYAANPWITDFFPNALPNSVNRRTLEAGRRTALLQRAGEYILNGAFGDQMEKSFSFLEKAFISRHDLSRTSFGRIKAEDEELAFHPESPERAILDIYRQKMLEL